MNRINYLQSYLLNRSIIDYSVNQLKEIDVKANVAKVMTAALPVLSLYSPIGNALVYSNHCYRAASQTYQLAQHLQTGAWEQAAFDSANIAIEIGLLTARVANNTFSHTVTATYNGLSTTVQLVNHIKQGQTQKAVNDVFQMTLEGVKIALIFNYSIPLLACSYLLQLTLQIFKVSIELQDKHPLSAATQSIVALFYCSKLPKVIRALEELYKEMPFRPDSLENISQQIEKKKVVFKNEEEQEIDFGAHFHGYGKSLVKGANLTFRKLPNDEIELRFKLNHVYRSRLQQIIEGCEELKQEESLNLCASQLTGRVELEKTDFVLGQERLDLAHKVSLNNLGSIQVGATPYNVNLYDYVRVTFKKGETIQGCSKLLSFWGLDQALEKSTNDDLERLKLGHLYRTLFPKEALAVERSEYFFESALPELKKEIELQTPPMKTLIQEMLPKMRPYELFPGKIRYCIPSLADQVYQAGGRALTCSLNQHNIPSVIKMGLLSSQTRFENGINSHGICSISNFDAGSADSVFTQLLTEQNSQAHLPFEDLLRYSTFQSKPRLLISLDPIASGTYQYPKDCHFGKRTLDDSAYLTRKGILEFTQEMQNNFSNSNEVMLKERVAPQFFKALVVDDKDTKASIIKDLRASSLIEQRKDGEYIVGIGKKVDDFIKVETVFSEKLIA